MAKEKMNVTELGAETRFDGKLTFTDNVIISGKFYGSINASGNLEISETAECTVDKIVAKSVVISGNVNGDVEGQERVELCKGSVVKGNIKTANIRIADNVEFDGDVEMLEDIPSVDLFSVASSEYKKALHQKTGSIH